MLASLIPWKVAGEAVLILNTKRTDSAKSVRLALCKDVVERLRILDQSNNMPNFVCSTDGISRLPKFSPENLNVVAMDSRMRYIEKKIHLLETSMALVNSTCDKTDTRVNTLEVSVKA